MQERSCWLVCAVLLLGLLGGCSGRSDGSEELLVFAAASLAGALPEIVERYESREAVRVSVSYGGSQMLAQQIASGAPADILISAGEPPVDRLLAQGYLAASVPILSNRLVVAVRHDIELELTAIGQLDGAWARRVAIADPELAPAGSYAREALQTAGMWDRVQSRLVIGGDVRTALAYLESGNADAALVYASDVLAASNVRAFDVVPAGSYRAIVYPAAVASASDSKAASESFLEFLTGTEAREAFRAHGFQPYASGGPG